MILHVDQLGLNAERVADLHNAATDDGPNFQFAAGPLRIYVLPLVTKYRAARNHFQVRDVRKIIDDALGDAVAQPVRFRTLGAALIAVAISKRQDCDRFDGLRLPRIVEISYEGDHQKGN